LQNRDAVARTVADQSFSTTSSARNAPEDRHAGVSQSLDTTSLLTLAAVAVIVFTALPRSRRLADHRLTLIGNRALAKVRPNSTATSNISRFVSHPRAHRDLVVRMMATWHVAGRGSDGVPALIGQARIVAGMIGLMFS